MLLLLQPDDMFAMDCRLRVADILGAAADIACANRGVIGEIGWCNTVIIIIDGAGVGAGAVHIPSSPSPPPPETVDTSSSPNGFL